MVEAPLYKIENIQHDYRIPFSGPGGRRFKSSLPDQSHIGILQRRKTYMTPWDVTRGSIFGSEPSYLLNNLAKTILVRGSQTR